MSLRPRTILITATALVALACAGAALTYLRSARFQERVRSEMTARIQQATGLHVTMDQFALDILRGRFSVSKLDLRSTKGLALSIDQVSGSFRLASFWRPKIVLGELNLLRLHMTIRPQPGGKPWSLEPVIRRSLQVAARKAAVIDSWVEYDNRRIPLDLVLDTLECGITYRDDPQRYEVQVSYRNSPLLWSGRKFVYDLDAHLNVLPTGLQIVDFKVREDKSTFSGGGSLSPWSSPALDVRATGTLNGEDAILLTPALKDARGEVQVVIDIRVSGREYHLGGTFQGETVSYRTSVAHSMTGLFEVERDVLRLRDVRGRVGDGTFRVDGEVQLKPSNVPPNHIQVVARNVMIRAGSGIIDLSHLDLENTVDADVVLEWRQGENDFSAEGSVYLYGIPEAPPDAENMTALQGSTDFYYRKDAWYVKKASLSSPATALEVNGLDHVRYRVRVDTRQPAELFRMLRGFSASMRDLFRRRPDWERIRGRYHLDGEFDLRLPDDVSYHGLASVENGRWRNYGIDSLSGTASWNGSRLELHSMRMQKAGQTAGGEFWIESARQEDAYPDVFFDGTLSRISLASLGEFGVDLKGQVTGILNSPHLQVSYQQGSVQGEGRLEINAGSLAEQPFDVLSADVRIKDKILRITEGQFKSGSAIVRAAGSFDLDSRQMNLNASLKALPLAEIPVVKKKALPLEGRITATGDISGSTDKPEVKGSIAVEGLRYGGLDLGNGTASLTLHEQVVTVANIDFRSDLGAFQGDARIRTEPGYPGTATLKFSDWNVKKIIAANTSELFSDLTTKLYGSLVIEGPFADEAKLTYRDGRMSGASFTINKHEFRNDGEIRFSGDAEKIKIERAVLVGEGSNLAFSPNGVIPFKSDGKLGLRVTGKLDLGVLDHISYLPKVGMSGTATLNVNVGGSRSAPEVIGNATLENARIAYDDVGYQFSELQGNIIFSRDSILFNQVAGKLASGSIAVNGSAGLQNGKIDKINLQGSLRRARMRYPKDLVSTIDAELNLNGSSEAMTLTGNVSVLHAEYLRDFSLLEQILGGSSGGAGGQVSDSPFANISLNIAVHSNDDGLYIDNELARVRAGLKLVLRGTVAEPFVTGRVTATDGSIFFRGNRFDIVDGTIDFLDRNRINPILNIRAEADVRSYRVRLDVHSPLENLHSSGWIVTSDPPLPQVDILSLLIMGKAGDVTDTGVENPRRQAEMTGLSAASIISEEMTGAVGKRVERIFGLSTFRVDPFLAGAENDPAGRVTISKRLASDLQVTFSRNLSTNTEQIVVIEYDVSRNLTIVATRDEEGKYGIDFKFRKRIR